jgi:hypothetical protein
VGPEKFTAKELICKQVSAVTDTQAIIEELFGTMFSIWSVQSGCKKELSFGNAECS